MLRDFISDTFAHDDQAALDAVQFRYPGHVCPLPEPEAPEQADAGLVMREDEADQRFYPYGGSEFDGLLQQRFPDTLPVMGVVHIYADSRRSRCMQACRKTRKSSATPQCSRLFQRPTGDGSPSCARGTTAVCCPRIQAPCRRSPCGLARRRCKSRRSRAGRSRPRLSLSAWTYLRIGERGIIYAFL